MTRLPRLGFSFISIVAFASAASLVSACADATPQGSDVSDDFDYTSGAQAVCARADYDRALEMLDASVAHAKERLAGRTCTDGNMIEDIANDVATATATCGYVTGIVKTSPSAHAIREALAGNLALAVVDGTLRVRNAAGQVVFEGIEDALARGVTVFGPATASYGNVSKLTFRANGQATISRSARGTRGAVVWTDATARYSVGRSNEGVAITIVEGTTTTTYRLREKPHTRGADWKHLPSFELSPPQGDAWATLPFECET